MMFNDFSHGSGGGGGVPLRVEFVNNDFDTIGHLSIPGFNGGNPAGGASTVHVCPHRVVIRECLIMPRPASLPFRQRLRFAWIMLRGRRP